MDHAHHQACARRRHSRIGGLDGWAGIKSPPMSESVLNLANHFLIAMPQLEDAFFARSVVYVREHNERGALGLVINKPGSLSFKALLEKIELPMGRADLADHPVFRGGPVQADRGFVLHDPVVLDPPHAEEAVYASTLTVPGGLEMTTSKEIWRPSPMGPAPGACWSPWAMPPGARASWSPSCAKTPG